MSKILSTGSRSSAVCCAAHGQARDDFVRYDRLRLLQYATEVAWKLTGDTTNDAATVAGRRLLETRLALQLHRFDDRQVGDFNCVISEAKRIAENIRARYRTLPKGLLAGPASPIALRSTRLGTVAAGTAASIHACLHYLGSPRGEGIHLGLLPLAEEGQFAQLLSLGTLSQFDLPHVASCLPFGIRPEQVLVLSRLFASPWAPRNTISHTLGRVRSWLREKRPDVRMLLTYLDPNAGFHGSVYRAANWSLFGIERKKRYLYLDGEYVTDRRMIREHGTADYQQLSSLLGKRIETSRTPLRPLELYVYYLDRRLQNRKGDERRREFVPPPSLVGA